MQAQQICLHASLEAKGGTGMVALAGEKLNLVLQDLKLNRDLKVNRVTLPLAIGAGSFGPFKLPADYLRTYDISYPLQGPNGMTQFLTPITMEQWDQEFKGAQTANYPYEFATDLSTDALAASGTASNAGTVASITVTKPGAALVTVPAVTLGGGGGSGATAAAHMSAAVVAISAAGAGFVAGDLVTAVGGSGSRPAVLLVQTIGGGGAIVGLSVFDPGDYTSLPAQPVSLTGGSGSGATFTVTYYISSVAVTAPGSGYTSAPTVTFTPALGEAATATLGTTGATDGGGLLYIYPMSNGVINATHRYMRNQPDIANPETSTQTPWFAFDAYLIKATAAMMMGITGDERQKAYETEAESMLRPYLIMEGDEQQTVRSIRLDPRHFHSNRGLRPTKVNPF